MVKCIILMYLLGIIEKKNNKTPESNSKVAAVILLLNTHKLVII